MRKRDNQQEINEMAAVKQKEAIKKNILKSRQGWKK
jgi:hypothetical protein